MRADQTVSPVQGDPTAHRAARPPLTAFRQGDAVLACAVGRDLTDVAPFVRSLRAVFDGRIILLVDRRPMLPAWLSTHGVETVVATGRQRPWRLQAEVSRFATFARILQERTEIRRAILADVEDIVFQSDPFHPPLADLQFHNGPGVAVPHPANRRIAGTIVGAALARDLSGRPQISPGLVAGPAAAVERFCRALLLISDAARAGPANAIDEAACHAVAHLGLAGGQIRPNFERVATVSGETTVTDGKVRNPDGTESPIILGYRRSPDLAAHIERRWGLMASRECRCAPLSPVRDLAQWMAKIRFRSPGWRSRTDF